MPQVRTVGHDKNRADEHLFASQQRKTRQKAPRIPTNPNLREPPRRAGPQSRYLLRRGWMGLLRACFARLRAFASRVWS